MKSRHAESGSFRSQFFHQCRSVLCVGPSFVSSCCWAMLHGMGAPLCASVPSRLAIKFLAINNKADASIHIYLFSPSAAIDYLYHTGVGFVIFCPSELACWPCGPFIMLVLFRHLCWWHSMSVESVFHISHLDGPLPFLKMEFLLSRC